MKDGLTTHVVLAAAPNLLSTFFKHYLTPGKNREDAEGKDTARVQLMYDQVFELVQRVLYISTLHTADSLQKLCQQRTPVPPWVAMHRVRIPQITSERAAEALVIALGGPAMAFKVAGGTKWWQVRAGSGVECEWLAMKKDYREKKDRTPDEGDCGFVPEMDRLRCMLFVHGGGYYCGSINTHHYFIWRLAKKIRGRVFAVNYRMAPQYPFPCAIQDVLASYMYLIDPPEGAAHRPVDPKNIIVAADSAGGGLSLVLLQILRDLDLPLPGGSILMSPWCDLTHSFPSVLTNTKTDVIPPYSFIHKPSSLWPPPPADMTHSMHSRIVSKVHHAIRGEHRSTNGPGSQAPEGETAIRTSNTHDLATLRPFLEGFAARKGTQAVMINPADNFARLAPRGEPGPTTLASGDNTLRTQLDGKEVVIDTQIQLYATNGQLCHPYVSPVLGYYGGLPPMLVIAGDSEVLRDEVIYLAHKAANPAAHPIREDVRAMMPLWDGIETKHQPTDVHLQVYDGVGHDIPLFCMTKPGHCAVRAIGAFARWVTPSAPGSLPTPPSTAGPDLSGMPSGAASPVLDQPLVDTPHESPPLEGGDPRGAHRDSLGYIVSETPRQQSMGGNVDHVDARLRELRLEGESPPKKPSKSKSWGGLPKAARGRAGWPGIYDGPSPFTDHMIRERVDMVGACRPLEPENQLGAMTMPPEEIGMIKTAAVMRYLEGQAKWDHKFARTFKRVARHRARNLKRAQKDAPKIVERWRRASPAGSSSRRASVEGTPRASPGATPRTSAEVSPRGSLSSEEYEEDMGPIAVDETWAWWWALDDELPPPSAVVSRRDLPEGRTLALQADRIDAAGDSELNMLSVWVILAQLFSTGEKEKIENAKYVRDQARARKGKWRLFGRGKGEEGEGVA